MKNKKLVLKLGNVCTYYTFMFCYFSSPNKVFQGNVEVWLKELLETVKSTVHSVIRKAWVAISDDSSFQLTEFENCFPAQIGLLGIQMLWTRDAEATLKIAKSERKVCEKSFKAFI